MVNCIMYVMAYISTFTRREDYELDMKLRHKFVLVLFALALFSFSAVPAITPAVEASTRHHSKLYQDAKTYYAQGKYKQAITAMEQAIKQSKMASYLRLLAESYEADKQFQKAADTYYSEAAIHYDLGKKSGNMNTYFAVLAKAEKLNTEVELYIEENVSVQSEQKLAKFEPQAGLYIGAYIEHDSNMEPLKADRYNAFNKLANKQHATYFTYHRYGQPFPSAWAANVKAAGGAIQLALEPSQGLDQVKDDAYLRQFAKDAQAAGVPIFLRYASEMNGTWVKWHGNPKVYIEKFRLVSNIMKELAPNVAMVWSPSSDPKQVINDYYPGDDYVDWVGLSMYSVKFFNGDAKSPADHVNPLDLLDYIYEEYADRKPIMVSEFGATHFSKAGNTDATQFSITKMNMLYNGVKLKYPRVKAIHWFSLNTLVDAHSAERMLNNFSLTENEKVLAAYSKMIQDPYFLSTVPKLDAPKTVLKQSVRRYENSIIRGNVKANLWIKTYDPYISKVEVLVDNVKTATLTQYPFQFSLNAGALSSGKHTLKVVVYDSKGNVASNKSISIQTGKALTPVAEGQVRMTLNDKIVETNTGRLELTAAPYVSQDRTLVPLRFVSTIMGATVDWNSANKSITIKADKTIVLTVGSKTATINGVKQALEVAPITVNGTTFVPLRFVNEQLGGNVAFNKAEQTIDIYMTKK